MDSKYMCHNGDTPLLWWIPVIDRFVWYMEQGLIGLENWSVRFGSVANGNLTEEEQQREGEGTSKGNRRWEDEIEIHVYTKHKTKKVEWRKDKGLREAHKGTAWKIEVDCCCFQISLRHCYFSDLSTFCLMLFATLKRKLVLNNNSMEWKKTEMGELEAIRIRIRYAQGWVGMDE